MEHEDAMRTTHRWLPNDLELGTKLSSSLESVWTLLSSAPGPFAKTIPVVPSSSESSRELNVRGEPASGLLVAELAALITWRGSAGILNFPSESGPEEEGRDADAGGRTVNETEEVIEEVVYF